MRTMRQSFCRHVDLDLFEPEWWRRIPREGRVREVSLDAIHTDPVIPHDAEREPELGERARKQLESLGLGVRDDETIDPRQAEAMLVLRGCTPREATTLVHWLWEGDTSKTADLLGITESTVRVLRARGLKRLSQPA
jgi:DNA-binding CsgD family transcriptional regulator